jgi:hypothetical protein
VGSGTELVWTGLLVLVVHGAWITAAVVASSGLRASLAGRSFGWRQPVGLLVVLLAGAAPLIGAGWWVAESAAGSVSRVTETNLPVYMDDAARRDLAAGTLLLSGTAETGYDVDLQRGRRLALGEDAVLPSAADQEPFLGAVGDLVTTPGPRTASDLASAGVEFVFAPAPVDPQLAGTLDAAPELAPASAAETGGRAWRLAAEPSLPRPSVGSVERLRPLWLLLQAVGLLTVAVLAAPTRRREP